MIFTLIIILAAVYITAYLIKNNYITASSITKFPKDIKDKLIKELKNRSSKQNK